MALSNALALESARHAADINRAVLETARRVRGRRRRPPDHGLDALQAEALFGYSEWEARDQVVDELLLPERWRAAYRAEHEELLRAGMETRRFEVPALHRDGRRHAHRGLRLALEGRRHVAGQRVRARHRRAHRPRARTRGAAPSARRWPRRSRARTSCRRSSRRSDARCAGRSPCTGCRTRSRTAVAAGRRVARPRLQGRGAAGVDPDPARRPGRVRPVRVLAAPPGAGRRRPRRGARLDRQARGRGARAAPSAGRGGTAQERVLRAGLARAAHAADLDHRLPGADPRRGGRRGGGPARVPERDRAQRASAAAAASATCCSWRRSKPGRSASTGAS